MTLSQSRIGVGGRGSELWVRDPRLLVNHTFLRVSRGRVMIEPGSGPAFLDGQLISSITPLYPDENVRIGDSYLSIERNLAADKPQDKKFGEMVSNDGDMHALFGRLSRYSAHSFHVLLCGESGTGKELAARGIHQHSKRGGKPFIAINCAALPKDLAESELFGHEKGAFTGANYSKKGAFHLAAGGTLFLDELGELDLSIQSKLLRVLENGEIRRVGGGTSEYPDVRIIAASNRNLEKMVQSGTFRDDLYYRIACLHAWLPPLRKRLDDIPLLSREILKHIHPEASITQDGLEKLKQHTWPGNIRELKNVLIRAFVEGGLHITAERIFWQGLATSEVKPLEQISQEGQYLSEIIKKHNGNRAAAARELGLSRSTLVYRLKRFGIK